MPDSHGGRPWQEAESWPVHHSKEIDSTNSEAMRRAEAGERGPFWVTADRQRAGRGRSGRAWVSEQGNLHASLLIELSCSASAAQQLSLVAGIATLDAIAAVARSSGVDLPMLRLKWPNDVLIRGAKAAGILIESTTIEDRFCAIVGIGLNLASSPNAAEVGRCTTHLARHGICARRGDMVRALSHSLAIELKTWDDGRGFPAVRARWLERTGPIGESISVSGGAGRREGTFVGLDDSGALLLMTADDQIVCCTFGDVSLADERTR